MAVWGASERAWRMASSHGISRLQIIDIKGEERGSRQGERRGREGPCGKGHGR